MKYNNYIKYRNKHKRCRYCKYIEYNQFAEHGWYTCLAKTIYLYSDDSDKDKYKGMFCSVFKPKQMKEE